MLKPVFFLVIEEKFPILVSKQVSIELAILKIVILNEAKVYNISDGQRLQKKYLECFQGIGK